MGKFYNEIALLQSNLCNTFCTKKNAEYPFDEEKLL